MYDEVGRRFGKVLNAELTPESSEVKRVLILDSLATRYHLLPSQVLTQADTLDYYVMDVAHSYEQYQRQLAEAKVSGKPMPANLTVDQMQNMLERVKNDSEASKK